MLTPSAKFSPTVGFIRTPSQQLWLMTNVGEVGVLQVVAVVGVGSKYLVVLHHGRVSIPEW